MKILCITVTVNRRVTRIKCENMAHAEQVHAGLRRALGTQVCISDPELIEQFIPGEIELLRIKSMLRWSQECEA